MEAAGGVPRLDDINRMLDSLTTNLQACDRREEDARQQRRHAPKPPSSDQHRQSRKGGDDVVIEFDAPLFAPRPARADDGVVVLVDPHVVQPTASRGSLMVPPPPPPKVQSYVGLAASAAEAPIIVCANDVPSNAASRTRAATATAYTNGGGGGTTRGTHSDGLATAVDDIEPWAAPGEWWDTGVRCVFEWLREAFAAALDRDARRTLQQSGISHFYTWPPVAGIEATAGGASAACSLTLMLRPWTPTDRPANAQRGRGGGPCGIEARRRDAACDLDALTASAERVVGRVEASGEALADRHAALSEAVRGCAACLRTLLRLAHDETDVLRAHGAATREAAVIATRAVGIAQKWIYARAVERVVYAADRYGSLDDALRRDFAHAQDAVRGQRGRFLTLWRDLKVRYDAFLADAGLDGADPAAAQAMEALFWRGAGGEPPIDPGSGDDPAVAVAAAAAQERGADPDAFDADALRLLRHYCEHMASVARSMLDRATDNDDDDEDNNDDDDEDDEKEEYGGHMDGGGGTANRRCKVNRRRRPTASRSAVDDAVSSVSSETRRRIAACVAGGDDRARILAEMRRARDQCRDLARQIIARRRERARLLRPVRRRHARRMRALQRGPQYAAGDPCMRDPDNNALGRTGLFDRDTFHGTNRNTNDHRHRHNSDNKRNNNNDDDDDDNHRNRANRPMESDSDHGEEDDEDDDLFLSSTSSSSDGDDDRPGPKRDRHDARTARWSRGGPPTQAERRAPRLNMDAEGDDERNSAQGRADRRQLEAAMAADAADARAEAVARKRLAHIEALMAGMAAQAVESGPHAEWTRATARLGDALAEAQTAWRQAAEARASREAVLEEETTRCLESVAATARAAHESDVGAVLCQWNERQHGIDRRRAEDLRQIAMARRVADEWLANFERKMVYYHEDVTCADAVGAVSEFRAIMGLHAGARGALVRLAEFADAYEDLTYAWTLAYKVEYGEDDNATLTTTA